jgi:hypothetical protein
MTNGAVPSGVSIAGTVFERVNGTEVRLKGAAVRAEDETGQLTPPTYTTADDGRYVFSQLPPGRWKLTAHCASYAPSTVVVEAPVSKDQQDLELTRALKVTGTVSEQVIGNRIKAAVVKATPEQAGESRFEQTTDDGRFSFDALHPGTWTFVAFSEDYQKASTSLDLDQDRTDLQFKLYRREGTPDTKAGKHLFTWLCLGLIGLIIVYVLLHLALPPAREPLGSGLAAMVDGARQQVVSAQTPSQDAELQARLAQITSGLSAALARNPQALSPQDSQLATDLIKAATDSIAADRPVEAQVALQGLHGLLIGPPPGSFFWDREPLRFVEVMTWGTAGILVYLILTTGHYLRRGSFYREGIFMHLAQLITMPVVALVAVLILSQLSFTVAIGGSSQLSIDLKQPVVLAAASFLIGSKPWESWRFVQSVYARVAGEERDVSKTAASWNNSQPSAGANGSR